MDWKILDSLDQLNELIESPDTKSFVIFKHSTRCGISTLSKNRLEKEQSRILADLPCYYLDLLTYRPVSDAIANLLEVEHQSPQLLLVQSGRCIYHASHSGINIPDLEDFITPS